MQYYNYGKFEYLSFEYRTLKRDRADQQLKNELAKS
jgi:hypothetical protein